MPDTKDDVLYLYAKNAGGKICRGNVAAWRIDGVGWRRGVVPGDMRKDVKFKDADDYLYTDEVHDCELSGQI